MRIQLKWDKGKIKGRLNNSSTAQKLLKELPVTSKVNCWGKEVYFSVPVSDSLASDATDVVDPGTICFWVQGSSIAIPFGPTPASMDDECRLVTNVNIIGNLEGDVSVLGTIMPGDEVIVEREK